jgi:glycosyltransferase involved in cell wall biosynthesis
VRAIGQGLLTVAERILLQYAISGGSGWGLYGLNLALNWAMDGGIEALIASPIQLENIAIDSLRLQALMPCFTRSLQFQAELKKHAGEEVGFDGPVLRALGNHFVGEKAVHDVTLWGKPTIGAVFFEEPLDDVAIERAKRFSLVVTGSTWNERLLRAYGLPAVHTVFQGIDQTYFHPAPKLGVYPGRFLVFSGGKAELRKGQDIVLAAFKIFARRHPEALLVTAWHSPWPQLARSLDRSGILAPIQFDEAEQLDVVAWAAANGVGTDQILDLGAEPNMMMPAILREMDVAVFPNRAEGGTNLVAMECMACGVPVILSRNTGHLDLIEDGNCYVLDDQRQTPYGWTGLADVPGWGESQIEEVVACLEQAFADRADARCRGAKAAEKMSTLTWAATARKTKELVLGVAQDLRTPRAISR